MDGNIRRGVGLGGIVEGHFHFIRVALCIHRHRFFTAAAQVIALQRRRVNGVRLTEGRPLRRGIDFRVAVQVYAVDGNIRGNRLLIRFIIERHVPHTGVAVHVHRHGLTVAADQMIAVHLRSGHGRILAQCAGLLIGGRYVLPRLLIDKAHRHLRRREGRLLRLLRLRGHIQMKGRHLTHFPIVTDNVHRRYGADARARVLQTGQNRAVFRREEHIPPAGVRNAQADGVQRRVRGQIGPEIVFKSRIGQPHGRRAHGTALAVRPVQADAQGIRLLRQHGRDGQHHHQRHDQRGRPLQSVLPDTFHRKRRLLQDSSGSSLYCNCMTKIRICQ